jgi:flavorubredoxin
MLKVLVLYYSRTGNTEKMAQAVVEGARSSGKVYVELSYYVEPEDLVQFDAVIVGTPTYNHAVPADITKIFEDAAFKGLVLRGKTGAAFGSYGWSGEAPKNVLEIMKNKFDMNVVEPALIANYVPDQVKLAASRDLGKRVSESLIQPV